MTWLTATRTGSHSEFMEQIVAEIVARYGTRDPREMAGRAGVPVVFGRWHPVTVGEFERKTGTIRVNLNAEGVDAEEVIAHELGHYFAAELKLDREDDERFAREFAELLKN